MNNYLHVITVEVVHKLTIFSPFEYYAQGVFFMRRSFGRSRYRKWVIIGRIGLFVIVVFFTAVFVYFEMKVSPFMSDFTIMKGRQTMTELFSETVNEKMTEMNLSYDKLMNITYSQNGEVQSLNTDVVTINELKNEVTEDLSEKLSGEFEYVVELPIGSIINTEFLSGSGKAIEFNNIVTGDVSSEFRSEFETGGVNQTIHRLYIDITGDLLIIGGGEQEPIEMTTSVLVGETVLVGNVPAIIK